MHKQEITLFKRCGQLHRVDVEYLRVFPQGVLRVIGVVGKLRVLNTFFTRLSLFISTPIRGGLTDVFGFYTHIPQLLLLKK